MKEIYTEPADVPFLPCRMSEGDWFYPLSDAALPIEFWLNNHAKYYGNVLDAWSRKIGILRNSQLGGRYPWRAWADTCYLYHDSVLSNPDWDTHSHLLALLVEDDQSASYGWEGDIYGDNYANGYRSFQLHRNFWLAADREGYPELGNAMLAFYLLCKSLRDADEHPHLEVDWALFPGVLRMALTRPGHDYVRQAVEFMKAICSEKGWNLDLLRLKNVVPDSGATTSFPKSTSVQIVEPVGAIVAREIERLVGSEDWKKLSNRSRKLLVEAETRFRNITQTIGAGITEFGPETLAYARCFENELHERLRDIYCSPAMVTFWEREYPKRPLNMHPTLGSYIKLLESDLPADISKMIEAAGVRLHMNRDLLRRLHVLQARRNEGGHTSRNVAAEQLHRQRGAIFEERLLNEFLSALSPCAST